MKTIVVFSLFLFFAASVCAQSKSVYKISGTVIDADTKKPLADKFVHFYNLKGDKWLGKTWANGQGEFQFEVADTTSIRACADHNTNRTCCIVSPAKSTLIVVNIK